MYKRQGERTAFTSFCHKRKAILPALSQNEYFKSLYDGFTSNEPSIKESQTIILKTFVNTIHHLLWLAQKLKFRIQLRVYHFKIHDVFYHRSGPMTAGYGHSPCYAQLYFYDVDTAVNYRLREHYNQTCNNNTMREIS